jgi:ectoine hydroxylase
MDITCLDHCLTESEHLEFEQNGYFMVEDVLPPSLLEKLCAIGDRIDAHYRPTTNMGPHERLSVRDCLKDDDLFVDLLDWPRVFPKVWGILGWNIQMYHSTIVITPPEEAAVRGEKKRWGWHQDSGRLNAEMEGNPRPRISLKVGFFLTDTTQTDKANLYVVPGSHLHNEIEFPSDGLANPQEAVPLLVPAGAAVVFDRRLWHAASPNYSDTTRKLLLYGYSYRWIRPRDNMTIDHLMDRCDPIRRQLLGAATDQYSYSSPTDADVPLKTWIEEQLGSAAVAS